MVFFFLKKGQKIRKKNWMEKKVVEAGNRPVISGISTVRLNVLQGLTSENIPPTQSALA